MDLGLSLDLAMALALVGLLLGGFPVAFTLAGTAIAFAALAAWMQTTSLGFLNALPGRVFGIMTNEVLIAIPLFILMGLVLERSKVAEDLLESVGALFGSRRGGLAYAVTVVGALLAASTGIVGATAVTMGLISLPVMLRYGYSRPFACGSIAAAATLAQIIPPSTVLIVLGDQLSAAHQSAQFARGVFAAEAVTLADLFAGALVPGLLLAAGYLAWQSAVAWLQPQAAPAAPERAAVAGRRVLRALVAPVALILGVLGSILAGIATPTEAAAVGAAGALLLAAGRDAQGRTWPFDASLAGLAALFTLAALFDLRLARDTIGAADAAALALALALTLAVAAGLALALLRLGRDGLLTEAVHASVRLTAMIFTLLIGATLFSLVFLGLGGNRLVEAVLGAVPGGPLGAVVLVLAAMFVMGFLLDAFEIVFLVIPVVAPTLLALHGIDPVWLGVMMAIVLQTSFLTPPFGPTLFYLRSVAPPEVSTADIYRGIVPFVVIQLAVLALVFAAPALATRLPALIYG